jgi:hypothetical protein
MAAEAAAKRYMARVEPLMQRILTALMVDQPEDPALFLAGMLGGSSADSGAGVGVPSTENVASDTVAPQAPPAPAVPAAAVPDADPPRAHSESSASALIATSAAPVAASAAATAVDVPTPPVAVTAPVSSGAAGPALAAASRPRGIDDTEKDTGEDEEVTPQRLMQCAWMVCVCVCVCCPWLRGANIPPPS